MKMGDARLTLMVALLALLLVPFAAGQANVPMSFDGTYSAVSCIGPEGCVGAGLYGGTINGVTVGQGQAVPGMICDDYFDNITPGQTWTAKGVDVANLTASNIASFTLFGATIGVSGYTEVAYLANMMLTTSGLSSAQQAGLSEAIWFITSKGASGALAPGSWGATYLSMALSALGSGSIKLSQFTNLYLYLPTPLGKGEPQEMFSLVPVPEGGAAIAYLLLSGLCCLGAMRLKRRQRGGIGA